MLQQKISFFKNFTNLLLSPNVPLLNMADYQSAEVRVNIENKILRKKQKLLIMNFQKR